MGKVVKIFENEKEKYSGNCYVNTVIFRGKIGLTSINWTEKVEQR